MTAETTEQDTESEPSNEVEWRKAHVPDGARFIYYACVECGHRITVSPRGNSVVSSLYCAECEHGPPFSKYAVEFEDEVVYRPGHEDREIPRDEEDE